MFLRKFTQHQQVYDENGEVEERGKFKGSLLCDIALVWWILGARALF
jgi:hypothetical protein